MRKAVFLDKDGTLIADVPYNVDVDKITLQPNSIAGLRSLQDSGYLLIIVSNQAGIAQGRFTAIQLDHAMAHLCNLLKQEGIEINAIYYCPHYPEAELPEYRQVCDCRKPLPGLIIRAAKDLDIDIAGSWMIGDILNDVEAGNRAGCRSILIDNGNETEWKNGEYRSPGYSCSSIDEAAAHITNKVLLHD